MNDQTKPRKLTMKQKMFTREYMIDLNATQAAIRAGYSEKIANKIGPENMVKHGIQAEIQKLMNERTKRVELDADYVLGKLKKIADDDIKNYLEFKTVKVLEYNDGKPVIDDEGNPIYHYKQIVEMKDSKDIDTWNISEISLKDNGTLTFKTHCKDVALVNLGKHLKLFTDKVEHSGVIVNKIELMKDEELDAELEKINKG